MGLASRRWLSGEGATAPKTRTPAAAVGPNPTDRGKDGSTRHVLTEGRGVPMATIVTAANVNDHTALPELLDARIAVAPPRVERRRWPVERTHAWHNRFRRLLIRWEKKAENWLALIQLANALIAFRACYW